MNPETVPETCSRPGCKGMAECHHYLHGWLCWFHDRQALWLERFGRGIGPR